YRATSGLALLHARSPTPLHTLSLHDALPILMECPELVAAREKVAHAYDPRWALMAGGPLHEKRMKQIVFTTSPSMPVSEDDIPRSEEHTSELQSRENLVCRLLLEKKKTAETS